MAKYNVHAGHCPKGKGASGAVGLLNESVEDRLVKNEVIKLLKEQGHTVYDCTCDSTETQSGCLDVIVSKCNKHSVSCDVSIHLNSGRDDNKGDGKTGGVEVWCYSSSSKSCDEAKRICKEVSKELGITNRGVKFSTGLRVLSKTKSPALLVECCFVDDKDDYEKWNAKKCAKAIVEGLLNKNVSSSSSSSSTTSTSTPTTTSTNTGFKAYKVKVNTDVLNVRKDASASSKKVTTVKKGDVYTIVGEKKNGSTKWGQLKSGIGYVALSYCKKC